jgi:hypothetical protein
VFSIGRRNVEAFLQPEIQVDDVQVHIVEQCGVGIETECNGQAPAERLDQPPVLVRFPVLTQVQDLPALSTGPLQWWTEGDSMSGAPAVALRVSICFGAALRRIRVDRSSWCERE